MSDISRGQLVRSAAEVYDTFFVPALFGEWAPRMADSAQLRAGQAVLDVACGTGVLAREAWSRVAPDGTVCGLDCNADMLAVAARREPAIDWQAGQAEALPFDSEHFDVVTCQFGLMFFEDRQTALAEMWRVLRPGGRLLVAVWDTLDNNPGYAAMVGLLGQLFGAQIADALRAPFVLGEPAALRTLCREAGIADPQIRSVTGSARFPSIADWVHTDIKGWTLADRIDEAQYARLRDHAETALAGFRHTDGRVIFDSPAHIVIAHK